MAIKLTTVGRIFIPRVSFPTDDGVVSNRELPIGEQVKCEVSLAGIDDKTTYLGIYREGTKQFSQFQYEKCVRKHCNKINGLEAYGIVDGKTLCNHEPTPELNDIIQEVFFKVCSIHEDDTVAGNDGGSELTEKE